MAIAIASMTMTACSLDSNESEKPILIIDPVEESLLAACGISESGTRSDSYEQLLFTDRDIEWFNITIKFYLGDEVLFVVSSFVGDWDSRTFTDLVLHYDVITDPNQGHYYLQDCYPLQFIDTDEVKANIKKRAGQWELFIYYLESKGKLRK